MNNDRDPNLAALFAQAEVEFDDHAFTQRVMQTIDNQRRNTMIVWSVLVAAVLVFFALVATPIMTAFDMMTGFLPTSVISVESDWLQKLLAPVNSVAAVLALGILLLTRFFRRLFS